MNSEIYNELPTFHIIGMLRDILKNYPDDISLTDPAESDILWNFQHPATEQVEYMDF